MPQQDDPLTPQPHLGLDTREEMEEFLIWCRDVASHDIHVWEVYRGWLLYATYPLKNNGLCAYLWEGSINPKNIQCGRGIIKQTTLCSTDDTKKLNPDRKQKNRAEFKSSIRF